MENNSILTTSNISTTRLRLMNINNVNFGGDTMKWMQQTICHGDIQDADISVPWKHKQRISQIYSQIKTSLNINKQNLSRSKIIYYISSVIRLWPLVKKRECWMNMTKQTDKKNKLSIIKNKLCMPWKIRKNENLLNLWIKERIHTSKI